MKNSDPLPRGSALQYNRLAGLLILLLGMAWNARAQGKVTIQEPRSTQKPSNTEDGWGQPSPRKGNRRTKDDQPPSRTTDRVFRRIQGNRSSNKASRRAENRDRWSNADEIDYAAPQKLIEMSFRVAPSVTYNTAEGFNSYAGFRENGAGLRLSIGPTLDYFFFKDRYAFSTGVWYSIHRTGYQMPGQFGKTVWDPAARTQRSVYNLQYLQIPLSAKMYANNLFPNARFYIQTGALVSIKLAEKAIDSTHNGLYQFAENNGSYTRQYSRSSLSLLLGTGIQYRLNRSQALIMGVSYQRGLTDVARARDLVSKNNVIALELGLKF